MKSELIEYFKQEIRGRFIVEVKVWRVNDKRYPYNLKYSLIFVERKTGRRVLMDNHHPKTPHIHLNEVEFPYEFESVGKLLKDFRNYVFYAFGEKI